MSLSPFIRTFFRVAGGKIALSLLLLMAVGVIQGVGLLLILPFLHLVGIGDAGGQSLPNSAKWLVDAAAAVGIPWTLPSVLILFVLAVSVVSLLRFWQSVQSSSLVRVITSEFQVQFYRQWLFRPWIESNQQSSGEVLNLVQRDVGQLSQFLNTCLRLISALVLTTVYLIVSLQLSAPLTAIALGAGAILFLVLYPLRKRMLSVSHLIRQRFSGQYTLISEHLNALKLIKAFGREPDELAYLAESTKQVQTHTHRITVARALTGLIQGILGAIILAIIVYASVNHLFVDTARLVLLVFLFGRIVPKLMELQQNWQQLLTTLPSLQAFAKTDVRDAPQVEKKVGAKIELNSDLQIQDLSFSWPDAEAPILKNISAAIPLRKITAISGESGSGKSTLSQLLLGLIAPSSGSILVNDSSLSDLQLEDWNHSIGYVPQNDFLFSQSIRQNLLWGKPDASEEELWSALESASADTFVKQLPDGIETIVAEKGDSLSGGERQRIALARALIRKPTLLILDEATSALDSETEAAIRAVLEAQKDVRTVVLVSHRASVVEIADHVIELG